MRPPITRPGPPRANLAPLAPPRGGTPPRPLRAPAGVSAPAAQSSRRRADSPASEPRQRPWRTRCAAPRPSARPAHPRSAFSQPGIARNGDTETRKSLTADPGARRRSEDRRSGVVLGAESASGAANDASAGATHTHWRLRALVCLRISTAWLTKFDRFSQRLRARGQEVSARGSGRKRLGSIPQRTNATASGA
jgi:hypothetical protein